MFSPRRTVPRAVVVVGCLVSLLTAVPSAAAAAEPPATPAPAATPASTPDTGTVTLVTGDTVTLGAPVGGRPTVAVEPAEGSDGFATLHRDGDVYVVPDDVAGLVPQVLDLGLFNISDLVEMGYDDASTDRLPLIVRGGATPLAASGAGHRTRPLPSIDAVAISLPKDDAADFADTVTGHDGPRAAGSTRVWLDRKVRAAELDWNLNLIGAPQVWDSGLSGEGVDVAVLDTGVDAEHPDLRGKVVAAADFTDEGSTADGNGHGTHVASIIAGTGAAAGGARKGVAHGARLLSGKVLDSDGVGRASWVIAGMRWAAEQGAEVVNLSLGGPASRDGDDPVAKALDALTADTGALFVAAAGNWGPYGGTIDTPGVAASALTVGAAGRNGRKAFFSGVGPTRGTYRAKPDLIAPGVGITAARAGGGTADPYTGMTGTSQATPHVAGAAALLMQRHPGWNWQRVKTALMTTADAYVENPQPHGEGAGLLDLPGAMTETLRLDRGDVDFGYRRYPGGEKPATIEVGITNTGDTAQTLAVTDLARDVYWEQAPEDLVTVSPAELTVAPGATGRLTVTLTPANAGPGVYGGAVILDRTGLDPIALPLNVYLEPPRHDVRLTVLDRNGEPWAGGQVRLGNMREIHPKTGGGYITVRLDENGQGTARVAPGPFSILAKVQTPAGEGRPATVAIAGTPEVMVDSDISYTVDARKAQRLEPATVEGVPTTVSHVSIHYARHDEAHTGGLGDAVYATREQVEGGQVFLQPTGPVEFGTVAFETRWRLETVGGTRGTRPDLYELVLGGETVPEPPVYGISKAEARDLAVLESDYRSLLGTPDTYVETRQAISDRVPSAFTFVQPIQVPQRRVERVTAAPGVQWRHCVAGPAEAVAQLCTPQEGYQPGQRLSPVWFRAPAPTVIAGWHSRNSISIPLHLSDGEHKGRVWNLSAEGNRTLRLFRDGVQLRRFSPGSSYFESPPEPAMFRLEHSSTPDQAILPIGAATKTTWTFPSQAPTDPSRWATTPRLLSVDYQPDTDDAGRLPAGVPLRLGVRLVSTAGATDAITLEPGTVRFWASTDQGGRWYEATVTPRADGSYQVVVPGLRPRSGEVVSVRAYGEAAHGRTVDQTIIDAYPVR